MIKIILPALFFCLLAPSVFAAQGWYLLVPASETQADRSRPDYRRWVQFGAYDTAAACQRDLDRRTKEAEQADWQVRYQKELDDLVYRKMKGEITPEEERAFDAKWRLYTGFYMRLIAALCIASDDPRLK